MSQSLYTAMGGISAAQTSLNVISNNIANLNTTGFKSSSVNFSDVFYTTISSGTAATDTTGGVNPEQVGLGVQVSSVSRDFSSGTWVSTGKTTDLMIQGNGFFTCEDSSGQQYYTRAGDFSFDSDGDLVTSDGYKVLGTNSLLSATSSTTAVHIPQKMVTKTSANDAVPTLPLSSLNNCNLTSGDFNIAVNGSSSTLALNINTTTNDTMGKVATSLQNQLNSYTPAAAAADTAAAAALPRTTPAEIVISDAALAAAAAKTTIAAAATAAGFSYGDITVKCDATTGGTIQFNVKNGATSIKFSNPATNASNFLKETGLGSAKIDASKNYVSNILDYKVDVTQVTSVDAASTISSYSIGSDGSIEATYNNGDTLAVEIGTDGNTYQFIYTTAEGVKITGNDVNVDPNVATPANFVIQLANVTNSDGLIATGSNLYTAGPNAGDILYSVGDKMGLGGIASGGLEASNVDLSSEFSGMILAQRAVQANSRVFSTTSTIMDAIVQMGR